MLSSCNDWWNCNCLGTSLVIFYYILSYTQGLSDCQAQFKNYAIEGQKLEQTYPEYKQNIDADTPAEACEKSTCVGDFSECFKQEGQDSLILVASQEFEGAYKQGSLDGDVWSILDIFPFEAEDQTQQCFSKDNAFIQDGHLHLQVSHEETECSQLGPSPGGHSKVQSDGSQAAVDTWNKLCFTGGFLELSMTIPQAMADGDVSFRAKLVGNLYRDHHEHGWYDVAYWSYDTCEGSDEVAWGSYEAQRWNGCDGGERGQSDANGLEQIENFGIEAGRGRGAPVIELFRNVESNDAPNLQINQGLVIRPMASPDASFPEGKGGTEVPGVNTNLRSAPIVSSSEDKTLDGPILPGVDAFFDVLGAVSTVESNSTGTKVKIGVYWDPGEVLRFFLNDVFVLEVGQDALIQLEPSRGIGERIVPQEAMYLALSAIQSENYNLQDPESILIDYVRLYQLPEKVRLSCSPDWLPTSQYVACHPSEFLFPDEDWRKAGECEVDSKVIKELGLLVGEDYEAALQPKQVVKESTFTESGGEGPTLLIIIIVVVCLGAVLVACCILGIVLRQRALPKRTVSKVRAESDLPAEKGADEKYGKSVADKQLLGSEQTVRSSKVGVGRMDGDGLGVEGEEMRRVAERLMEGMVLGEMLGFGSYGRVYKAIWNGADVAVKVIVHTNNAMATKIAAEVELSMILRHPNIVATYHAITRTANTRPLDSTWGSMGVTSSPTARSQGASTSTVNKSKRETPSAVSGPIAEAREPSQPIAPRPRRTTSGHSSSNGSVQSSRAHSQNGSTRQRSTPRQSSVSQTHKAHNGASKAHVNGSSKAGVSKQPATAPKQDSGGQKAAEEKQDSEKSGNEAVTLYTNDAVLINTQELAEAILGKESPGGEKSAQDSLGDILQDVLKRGDKSSPPNTQDRMTGIRSMTSIPQDMHNMQEHSKPKSKTPHTTNNLTFDQIFRYEDEPGARSFPNPFSNISPIRGGRQHQHQIPAYSSSHSNCSVSHPRPRRMDSIVSTVSSALLGPPPSMLAEHSTRGTIVDRHEIELRLAGLSSTSSPTTIKSLVDIAPQGGPSGHVISKTSTSPSSSRSYQGGRTRHGHFGQLERLLESGSTAGGESQQAVSGKVLKGKNSMIESTSSEGGGVSKLLLMGSDLSDRRYSKGKAKDNGRARLYSGAQDLIQSEANETNSPRSTAESTQKETWIVQEYCDYGSLAEAVQKENVFGKRGPAKVSNEAMKNMLLTARDICRGMVYLHKQNVLHGDLKASNVLLCTKPDDPRGFIVKVADFGLSRRLSEHQTSIATNTYGTVSHMPPELLLTGRLSSKVDVYSFGILLWELWEGMPAWQGMMHGEIIRKVVIDNARPQWTRVCEPHYRKLVELCWTSEQDDRPDLDEVLEGIEWLLQHVVKS